MAKTNIQTGQVKTERRLLLRQMTSESVACADYASPVGSRLLRLPSGRPYAVEITVPAVGLPTGCRFTILGSEIRRGEQNQPEFGLTDAHEGRAPSLEEQAAVQRAVGVERLEQRKWSDADRERARELQAEGLSWQQIADRVGCSKASVGAWLRAA